MFSLLNHELLNSLDMAVLTVGRSRVSRYWNYRNVISPFSRYWLVMGGRAIVRHHGRTFTLKPGQLHLVPAFASHDCSCSNFLDHYHLHFSARLPTGIDLFSMLDCDYQIKAPAGALALFRRLESIYPDRRLPCSDPSREEYKRVHGFTEFVKYQSNPLDGFESTGVLTVLISEFLRFSRTHEGAHARVTRQFMKIQELIHANMHRRILLGELARTAGLNPTYFSDRFARIIGLRPLAYVMRRRIERAQFLLLTSRAPVKEVANAVGIPDPAYFSRVFARICKVSPSDYRLAHSV
ncbi:MAG: AraC family transcriptional regulator [Opitutaceae bacterium]|jgi:AraC-like DNA-binding protein